MRKINYKIEGEADDLMKRINDLEKRIDLLNGELYNYRKVVASINLIDNAFHSLESMLLNSEGMPVEIHKKAEDFLKTMKLHITKLIETYY